MPREQRRRPQETTTASELTTGSFYTIGSDVASRPSALRAPQATAEPQPQRQMSETELVVELVNLQVEMEAKEREAIRVERESRDARRSYNDAPSFGEPPRRRDMGYLNLERASIDRWGRGQMNGMFERYEREVAHRLNWIFNRIEREGFTRRLRTGENAERLPPFSLDDLRRKLQKPHPMNTDNKQFYDWKLNNSEFMLRLEYFTKQYDQDRSSDVDYERTRHYLRVWILHKPSGRIFGYQDRLWDGGRFKERQAYWAEE